MIITRRSSYADSLRDYQIYIDDEHAGAIGDGEMIELYTTPGLHKIVLRIDWCSSKEVVFDIRPGRHVWFECGSHLIGWRLFFGLLYITFIRDEYIDLNMV